MKVVFSSMFCLVAFAALPAHAQGDSDIFAFDVASEGELLKCSCTCTVTNPDGTTISNKQTAYAPSGWSCTMLGNGGEGCYINGAYGVFSNCGQPEDPATAPSRI